MEFIEKLIFLCPLLFIAGLVDGISGGGGVIALPSYLLAGLPISSAYACNKMQSCLGTAASAYKYIKSGFVDFKSAIPASLSAMLGSFLATQIMLRLPDGTKSAIITVSMIFVVIITLLGGRRKIEQHTAKKLDFSWKTLSSCLAIGLILGLYDGFFGPGGGTVAILLFSIIMKYDLRVGGGIGKVIIVISNLTSLISYIAHGSLIYHVAIPASIANIIGSFIGASLATRMGTKFVKYVSYSVVCAVVVYALLKIFGIVN